MVVHVDSSDERSGNAQGGMVMSSQMLCRSSLRIILGG